MTVPNPTLTMPKSIPEEGSNDLSLTVPDQNAGICFGAVRILKYSHHMVLVQSLLDFCFWYGQILRLVRLVTKFCLFWYGHNALLVWSIQI